MLIEIIFWLCGESIKPPAESKNSFVPAILNDINSKLGVKFDGLFLKQDKVTFTQTNIHI